MPDRDLNTQRLFESALYGTPSYHGVRTPDGRVLSELHQLRLDEERRGTQLVRIQEDLVEGLRAANQGSTAISRQDFSARQAELLPVFREAASRIGGLYQTQAELLHESRALGRITASGFTAVEAGLSDVRSELCGVRGDIVDMDSHVTGAIEEGTRTLQGPSLPQESLGSLVARSRTFFDALSAYSKGILTQEAEYELRQLIDSRLRSAKAKAALRSYVDQKAEETVNRLREDDPDEDEKKWRDLKNELRRKGYELSGIIDRPSSLIYCYGTNEARDDLRRLEQISRQFPDEALRQFVHEALGLVSMSKKATHAPVPESFLVELTNSGLVVDGVQHQVKQRNRGARLAGTGVDRNYNLMELLEQGDHAKNQRGRLIELTEKQVGLGEMGVAQRGVIIGQGTHAAEQRSELIDQGSHAAEQRDELIDQGSHAAGQRDDLIGVGIAGLVQGQRAAEQRDELIDQGIDVIAQQRHLVRLGSTQVVIGFATLDRLAGIDEVIQSVDGKLTQVVSNLAVTNDHLVNLEELGAEFIDAVHYGFKSVDKTLVGGFNLVSDGLDQVASEIAISRAALISQLGQIDRTVELIGARIVDEVAYGNRILEKLLGLQEESLRNLAQQRLKQGAFFLKKAKTIEDFREARDLFQRSVDEDPTILEGQYGLGVAAEGMGDLAEAKRRFRNVGRLANKDKDEFAIGAWLKYAKQEEASGDLPSAIEATRQAVQRDVKNPNLRLDLARLLALGGLETEAEEIIFSVVEVNPKLLFQLKLESTLHSDFLIRVYKKIWYDGSTALRDQKTARFLFEECITFGEKETALSIFEYLLKCGPRFILKYDLMNIPGFSNILTEVKSYIIIFLTGDSDLFSAEDWYAFTFLTIKLGLDLESISKCFGRGLKHDLRYQKGEEDHLSELLEAINSLYPNFKLPNNQ